MTCSGADVAAAAAVGAPGAAPYSPHVAERVPPLVLVLATELAPAQRLFVDVAGVAQLRELVAVACAAAAGAVVIDSNWLELLLPHFAVY